MNINPAMTAAKQAAPSFTGAYKRIENTFYDFTAKAGDKFKFTADEFKKEFQSADKKAALELKCENMISAEDMLGLPYGSCDMAVFLTGKEAEQFKATSEPQYRTFFGKLFEGCFSFGGKVTARELPEKDTDLYIYNQN